MTENEYTQCSTYATAGDLTTDAATGNYVYHSYNYNQCIGCSHENCPYWRPPCHRRHYRPWPYPYRRYYPWWEWNYPYVSPQWTTTTVTWTANPNTTVIYNTGTDPQDMIGNDGTGWTS